MSKNDKNVLAPNEEQLLKFDEEVTIAIVEQEKEEDRRTHYLLTDTINEWGFISPAR